MDDTEGCGPDGKSGDLSATPRTRKLDPRWHGAAIPEKNWHFHRQLLARYGLALLPGEYGAIIRAIRKQTSDALLIERRREGAIYCIRLSTAKKHIFVLAVGGIPVTAWPSSRKLRIKRRQILDRSGVDYELMEGGQEDNDGLFDGTSLPDTLLVSADPETTFRIRWRFVSEPRSTD